MSLDMDGVWYEDDAGVGEPAGPLLHGVVVALLTAAIIVAMRWAGYELNLCPWRKL